MKGFRIEAPHFVAGGEIDNKCIRTAPIIKYMIGWTEQKIIDYCKKKSWKFKLNLIPPLSNG